MALQIRHNTAAVFAARNQVLAAGEPAYETDTHRRKWGDGVTAYNALAYEADVLDLGVIASNPQVADYTFVLADVGRIVDVDSSSAVALTVLPDVFPLGAVIAASRQGVGTVTFVEGSGVVVSRVSGGLAIGARYAEVWLRQRVANVWIPTGPLT